jgi:hypothetical protein
MTGPDTPPDSPPNSPIVPVSWGELLDKLTILEIKRARILAPAAQRNIATEHRLLRDIGAPVLVRPDVRRTVRRLKHVNMALWRIEDAIRREDAAARFGAAFIRLARAVYRLNDRRALLKRQINALLHSALVEEKSYAAFAAASPTLAAGPPH